MFKRDPTSAALWLIIAFALPLVGPWLYWVLGINRVERRAVRLRVARDAAPAITEHAIVPDAVAHDHERIGHLAALRSIADHVTNLPLLHGNKLVPLHNGEQAYPDMLDAIAHARKTITLASYIFDWDATGRDFAEALSAAARRGVRVHVLLDGVGAVGTFSRMGRFLIRAGAEIAAFFPLRSPLGRVRLNLRNHRKILVVDGRVGFTGGMNISQRYVIRRKRHDECEDLHFRITGPVVAEIQQTFAEDWFVATDTWLAGPDYFPPLQEDGPSLCRGIVSGPDQDFENIHWVILGAFAAAKHGIRVVTPYFVPTPALLSAMAMAAMRGVKIQLFLPSYLDLHFMRWAADAYLWQALEHDIQVFRRPPPFVHTKLMIVDERWTLLGSANFDRRSFRLNFEFNVEAYDPDLAGDLSRWLDSLIPRSERVTLESVDARRPLYRFRDGCVKLLSPYL